MKCEGFTVTGAEKSPLASPISWHARKQATDLGYRWTPHHWWQGHKQEQASHWQNQCLSALLMTCCRQSMPRVLSVKDVLEDLQMPEEAGGGAGHCHPHTATLAKCCHHQGLQIQLKKRFCSNSKVLRCERWWLRNLWWVVNKKFMMMMTTDMFCWQKQEEGFVSSECKCYHANFWPPIVRMFCWSHLEWQLVHAGCVDHVVSPLVTLKPWVDARPVFSAACWVWPWLNC